MATTYTVDWVNALTGEEEVEATTMGPFGPSVAFFDSSGNVIRQIEGGLVLSVVAANLGAGTEDWKYTVDQVVGSDIVVFSDDPTVANNYGDFFAELGESGGEKKVLVRWDNVKSIVRSAN
jgi:hypothetical protein